MELVFSLGLCLGLLGLYGVTGNHFIQPNHANLTQNATVLCTKNGTTYCMMFDLWANYDRIDLVFFRNYTDPTVNSAGVFDSDGNGIVVDNSTGYPQFWFSIYWTWPPLVLTPRAREAFAHAQGDVLSVWVLAKYRWIFPFFDWVTFGLDVHYKVSCNCSEIEDDVITTGAIDVQGDIIEYPVVVKSSARLAVFDDLTDLEGILFSLGELVYLEVIIIPQVGISIVPTGVYVYSCWVCNAPNCLGDHNILLILPDGCSNAPSFIDPFRLIAGWTRTSAFPIFQLNDQVTLYFQCTVGFCYKANDGRCIDFCDHNSGKRKRRQTEDEADEEENVVITHEITITRGSRPDELDSPKVAEVTEATPAVEETKTVGLIAAVITLSGLLLVGLIVAVAVFFRLSSRNRVHEKAIN